MEKWRYKSLEWIHNVREDEYERTKNLSPKELAASTRSAGEAFVKGLGLKVAQSKTTASRK